MKDSELLSKYVENKDESAFAEILKRYTGLVYGTALRRLDFNNDLAEDATQAVFIILAKKAVGIGRRKSLGGWLFTAAKHVVLKIKREEARRKAREEKAVAMKNMRSGETGNAGFGDVLPYLDGALDRLPEHQRDAVIMHHMEGKSLQSIADEWGCSKSTVQRRVDSGMTKLEKNLKPLQKGATVTQAGLVGGLFTEAIKDPPQAVLHSIHSSVMNTITGSMVIPGSLGPVVKGAINAMFWQKAVHACMYAIIILSLSVSIPLTVSVIQEREKEENNREEHTQDTVSDPMINYQGLPAFPGAEGYGVAATGGRGGRVVKVTNLNSKGPGSLQWACMQKGPVIVVFEVSGVIKPPNRDNQKRRWLSIRRDNITIAGQTAPGAGITVEGTITARRGDRSVAEDDRPRVEEREADNIILRFLRIRPTEGRGNLRSLEFLHCRRAIADHVSGSWGLDECFDLGFERGDDQFTLQWSSIEESDIHLEGGTLHAYAMLTGWDDGHLSMHHNLLANHVGGAPSIGCYRAEFSNNVMYNCGQGDSRIEWLSLSSVRDKRPIGMYNVIGNYWKRGPGGIVSMNISRPPRLFSRNGLVPKSRSIRARYFFEGNRFARDGYVGIELYSVKQKERIVSNTPLAMPPLTLHPADEAYELVLAHAGCLPRDSVSARTVAEVRTGTGSWGRHGPEGGLMEGLTPGGPPEDTDDDGMPDVWEKAHSLDPADPADNSKTVPAGASPGDRHKDYTFIEYYINELADLKVAEALTQWRLDRTPARAWAKPATELSGWGRKYTSLDEIVKVIKDQKVADPDGEGKYPRRRIAKAGWYAVQYLSRMGEEAAPAVPELIKALRAANGHAQATAFAAWALGAIGPAARDGVPTLIEELGREQVTGYAGGKWIFAPYGYIAWALGRIGMNSEQTAEAVPLLARVLKYRRARSNAAWVLSRLGRRAAPAQEELLKNLGSTYSDYFFAQTLSNIGKPVIPGLIKVIKSRIGGRRARRARASAVRALGWMGTEADEAVPVLTEQLRKEPSGTVRGRIAEALARIAPQDTTVVNGLADALTDEYLDVRVNAAAGLGTCGGPSAISALTEAFEDRRREVKRTAALALGRIGKDAIPVLKKVLAGGDPLVRKYAARAIGNVGKDAEATLDALVTALADKDADVRREAVWSLALIGPLEGARDALNRALTDSDYVVRYAAGEALKRIHNQE